MFVYAIETGGKTVALVGESASPLLTEMLHEEREAGKYFRQEIPSLMWDGLTPIYARLATSDEFRDFVSLNGSSDGDSAWHFYGDITKRHLKDSQK